MVTLYWINCYFPLPDQTVLLFLENTQGKSPTFKFSIILMSLIIIILISVGREKFDWGLFDHGSLLWHSLQTWGWNTPRTQTSSHGEVRENILYNRKIFVSKNNLDATWCTPCSQTTLLKVLPELWNSLESLGKFWFLDFF